MTEPTFHEGGPRPRLVVVGYGMVGHRLLEELVARGANGRWAITVFGEEPVVAYDRVRLSAVFDGGRPQDLSMAAPGFAEQNGIDVVVGEGVVAIDRTSRSVTTTGGRVETYDHLVLATGSTPFVPPVPGASRPGTFVYRTLDDLAAIRSHAEQPSVRTGVVVGGGLLGLEAANALRLLGLETHVVEMAPRLMPAQLDESASAVLRRKVEQRGIRVHTGVSTRALTGADPDDEGATVCTLERADGPPIPADIVVFSAGIRPRDELARNAGLEVGQRGGVVVDGQLATSDSHISAIGEVASVEGRCLGLVAPGYGMARVLAARLAGQPEPGGFATPDLSTKLKLLGIDVASFGDAFAGSDPADEVDLLTWSDTTAGVYKRLARRREDGRIVGGMLVGDAGDYQRLRLMAIGEMPTPDDLSSWVAPSTGPRQRASVPDAAAVCSCENVTAGRLRSAIADGARTVGDLQDCTSAGSGCAGCVPMLTSLLKDELRAIGEVVSDTLCEHFSVSRQALFDLVRVNGHRTWRDVLDAHGTGGGCDVCRPAVASILASRANGYVLDPGQGEAQDTNDHALANMQRNGTYSVIPRVPGGEITPAQLIALGEIAADFGLYCKITGGQRIDLLGARLEQLPAIWQRVLDAGMESGHAYGKAVRTVKSCVGETWCRYGVQDSVTMAIRLEERYRGLRAPHKLKLAVSGCTRECAEAQSKDVGVIATERGWNLYVAGNGGKTPRHATLLATDLDDEVLVRVIDRFLAYYVRTADRLQRTSTWFEALQASTGDALAHVRSVVIDDALGLCRELDAEIARHVETYECEWAATLADPTRLSRFHSFVNAPGAADPEIVMVSERGQPRPARPEELARHATQTPVAVR
ncbi:MAG TPA: nitrite reductase large subunit NirB [Acidimicrobiales bacterium]|nr:nitrite reductase large subunit NirB [Acidimicrobiales bacterium]